MSIDIEALLAPISEDQPCGADERGDDPTTDYYACKDASGRARAAERGARKSIVSHTPEEYLGWLTESRDEWREVRERGVAVLQNQSKDLEVATNVTEALFRLEGFPGLADGLHLLRELIERYGAELHPRGGNDEEPAIVTSHVANLGADRFANEVIGMYPLTEGSSVGPYAAWQYHDAERNANLDGEALEERLQRGGVTTDQFRRAIAESDPEWLRENYRAITRCREELEGLDEVLTEKAGMDAPSFRNSRDALDDCRKILELVAGEIVNPPEPAVAEDDGNGQPAGRAAGGASVAGAGALHTRDDAFRMLEDVARFFERTEPQSLIPAALQKVIRRGRMSTHELMWEVLPEDARDTVFREYDLPRPQTETEEY